MDLETALADPAYDIAVPVDGLAEVDRRARVIRRRRRAFAAIPALAATSAALTVLPLGQRDDALYGAQPSPSGGAALVPVPGPAPAGTRARFVRMAATVDLAGRAQDPLLHECMQAQGQRYDDEIGGSGGSTLPPLGVAGAAYGWTRTYTDQHGYGLSEKTAQDLRRMTTDDYVRNLPADKQAAWERAFNGGPEGAVVGTPGGEQQQVGGCLGEVLRQLWGSSQDSLEQTYLGNLGTPIYEAGQDPEMSALNAAWAACMAQQGEPGLTRPELAVERARSFYRSDPTTARAREITLAGTDADCEASTGYAQDRQALEDRYLAGFAVREGERFTHAEEVARLTTARAERVLDEHPDSP
jgi:hypothetical protein